MLSSSATCDAYKHVYMQQLVKLFLILPEHLFVFGNSVFCCFVTKR